MDEKDFAKRKRLNDLNKFKDADGDLAAFIILDSETGQEHVIPFRNPAKLAATLRTMPDAVVQIASKALEALHEAVDKAERVADKESKIRLLQGAMKDPEKQAELQKWLGAFPAPVRTKLEQEIRQLQGEIALREKEGAGESLDLTGPDGEGQFILSGDGRVH